MVEHSNLLFRSNLLQVNLFKVPSLFLVNVTSIKGTERSLDISNRVRYKYTRTAQESVNNWSHLAVKDKRLVKEYRCLGRQGLEGT